MSELNPDNPLVQKLHDQWHKICAMIMSKQKIREIRINAFDIQKLENSFAPNGAAVVAHVENANTPDEEIVLRLMDMKEGEKLMREFEGRKN